MKFTLAWLREHIDTDLDAAAIAEKLTMLGHEVEGIEDRARGLEGFVTARVVSAEKHPDADKLQVCMVDTGTETVQVVCGAPNARAGMTGVFAPSGAYIPGTDITLKKAAIRGVESNGMLLSEREMGLSDDHDGIVDLAADTPAGQSAVKVMGLDDPVIEIKITPNRGDCLGVSGIARDLAAAGAGTLKSPDTKPVKGYGKSPIDVQLDFKGDDLRACPYFVGRYVRGVKNGESPKWLQDRLRAIGLRPISALVDITNFMTFAHNRPLHVFDADHVKGDIHVRFAHSGETLLALDGKEYTLDPEMTVIADEKEAEALGGVMGGERTGCTADTVNVFIESAYFDPIRTAATGRKLQLMSDARYRFERGIDPAFLVDGMEIATRMVLDLCGGEASDLVIAGAEPNWQRSVSFRPSRVQTLAGVDVAAGESEKILTILGFTMTGKGDAFEAAVPSWRPDIVGEACLVEETIRIKGYDCIPTVPLPRETDLPVPALTPEQGRRFGARRVLAARGLMEAVTYSFMGGKDAALFGDIPPSVQLENPISADLDVMRPSILPNLIAAVGRNADRGHPDAALFEIGPQFAGDRPEDQRLVACGVRAGQAHEKTWTAPARPVDAFDAKADALALLSALGVPTNKVQVMADAPHWYHPGRSGRICLGPKATLAQFGEIHPGVLKDMDVRGPIAGFEVFFDALPPIKAGKSAARPLLVLSSLQPVMRDFAFVVDEGVGAGAIVRAAHAADKTLIADVSVFDVFAGKALGEGKKSVAVTVTLQPVEKTLTDAEIEAIGTKVVAAVTKATGASLRA